LKAGEGLSGKVVQIGQPLIVEDYTAWEGRSEKYEGSPFRAVMAVPLKWGQKIVGVVNVTDVEKPRAFSEHDLWLLELFANQAAIAIENARLYEGLRESEERYRTYVENVADAIWETDSEGHFTYWSPQVENLTGYAPEELLGHTAYELLTHPDDVEEFRNRIWQMVEEGREKFTLTYQALHRDGSILHIETSISPVRNDAGEMIKFQGVARDVSERVHLQAQLIQSAKLSGIGQMISGVAHELNNPLTTIMGYAQLLQVSDADESIKEDLQIIYNDAMRAQRIVQNLLTFARQKKPQRSPVDINEIIERTLALRSYQLKMDNVEVVTELVENLPWTMADDYQLQQVFLNIINNAHQAMVHEKGESILTIRSGLLDNDTIRVSFTDTGPGIPSDILDKVFDPFFTTKDVGTGTGLGLSVSHGIIQEHGGRIWAESQPGQGAAFFIELPVKSWLEDISLPSLDEEPEQMPSGDQRILVIDDERSIVSLMVRVLKESGYQVDGVTSAQLALKKLHQERYDLIISDIRMPDMDGPTCEEQVRATDPALAKRIIFITGDLLSPTTQAFLETWEGRSIKKPFDVEELRALVTEALS
jgi:two-component system NtrC family sensor kinase